jgi:hypothetical protein
MGDAATLFSQIYESMDGLKTELQAAKDRASTSYREGYEAGRAAFAYETRNSGPPLLGGKPTLEEIKVAAERARIPPGPWADPQGRIHYPSPCPKCGGQICPCDRRTLQQAADDAAERARPVLASNPLDPKCASIFEAAEMIASVTAAMRKLADALGAAEKRADGYKELATYRREQAWHSDSEATTLRDQLRLLAKERDEWRAEAAGRLTAIDDLRETVSALKRQLGDSQESLHHALERAERAEKMLTTERRA